MLSQELSEMLRARGVRPSDVATLEGRLAGRTFADLADERGQTRQALQIGERRALRAIGVAGSVESLVHADSRLEQRGTFRERARGTMEACDSIDRHKGRTKDPGEKISDRLWAELERAGGSLSPARWAYYSGLVSALFAAS